MRQWGRWVLLLRGWGSDVNAGDAANTEYALSEVAQREVRAALRTARHQASFTPFRVADELNWPLSKVLRCEQSSRPVPADDLEQLLRLYGLAHNIRQHLLALTRSAVNAPQFGYRE